MEFSFSLCGDVDGVHVSEGYTYTSMSIELNRVEEH